jgi:hypothetical protein
MAVTGASITDPVSGDDYDILVPFTGLPSGQTVTKAWLTVKVSLADLDAAATVQKIITTSAVAGQGQITDDGATDGTGELLFTLTPTNTRAIQATMQPLQYDVQIRTSAGKIYTLEIGTIRTVAEVTISDT